VVQRGRGIATSDGLVALLSLLGRLAHIADITCFTPSGLSSCTESLRYVMSMSVLSPKSLRFVCGGV
jgi:hypothetical protein